MKTSKEIKDGLKDNCRYMYIRFNGEGIPHRIIDARMKLINGFKKLQVKTLSFNSGKFIGVCSTDSIYQQ